MPPVTIDCHYLDQPEVAAAYLLVDGDQAAFVDNNTALAVPRLMAALAARGMSPSQVQYIIITHVHLDHAGGTGDLAALCPQATVLCHPRARRHVVDPEKLVRSARRVYGDEVFARLYGDIAPIPEARVRTLEDNEQVLLGGRPLTFLHTRGHANHHFCILDERDGTIFTGDAFGLVYPRLQRAGLFAFPSTSPTDFDPAPARDAVRRIVDSGADRACLTHFGEVSDLRGAAGQLLEHLDFCEQLLEGACASDLPDEALQAFCNQRLGPFLARAVERRGLSLSDEEQGFLALDRDINAQGIAVAAVKRRHQDD